MALVKSKPTSPGSRFAVKIDKSHLWKGDPYAPLTVAQSKTGGRNSYGRITTRHKGGGSRQKFRIIDLKRDKDGVKGIVERIEHDPNRTGHIALVKYMDGDRRYILAPKGVVPGDEVRSGADSPIKPGNAMQLRHIPVGSTVHNVELKPGCGGQLARSAGSSVQFTARELDPRPFLLGLAAASNAGSAATLIKVANKNARPKAKASPIKIANFERRT